MPGPTPVEPPDRRNPPLAVEYACRQAETVSLSVGIPRATDDTFRPLCARESFSASEALRAYCT